MNLDLEALRKWIGRSERREDFTAIAPFQALSAMLDREEPGPALNDPIPPCGHWLYFLPIPRQSEIGPDGHPRRGGFLPPVPLPRRMWAGSQIDFLRPLLLGRHVWRTSTILDVTGKEGRTGALVFVKVRHEIGDDDGVAVIEEQDLVYREAQLPGAGQAQGPFMTQTPQWSRTVTPDTGLLFRFSALTLNGHRIHYDRPYAIGVEHYPALVVHGPLVATLLLDLLRQQMPHATVRHFAFRAVAPLFDTASFQVCGSVEDAKEGLRLWAQDRDSRLAMDASVRLA